VGQRPTETPLLFLVLFLLRLPKPREKEQANTNDRFHGGSSPAFSFDTKGTTEESRTLPCFVGKSRKKKMP
jgi:hypothetical protein